MEDKKKKTKKMVKVYDLKPAKDPKGGSMSQGSPQDLICSEESAEEFNWRTIGIVDAHRDDGKRFIVRADEKLTAFIELETAIRAARNTRQARIVYVRATEIF